LSLTSIRAADIEDFIAALRARSGAMGRPLAAASINRIIELLRHMLNWAVSREYIASTPFRRGSETLIRKLPEDNRRRRRVSEQEEAQLLTAASEHLRPLIIAALDTGMRRGEMLSMRFGDIDWSRQLIFAAWRDNEKWQGARDSDRHGQAAGGPRVAAA
jgi:integrase